MKYTYNNKVHHSEVLLHNVVDDKFLELFKPLHVLNIIFCLRKFDIYHNCITPLTRKDALICVPAISIVYLLLIVTLKYFAAIFDIPTVFIMYLIAYLQYAVNYTILSFMNIFAGKTNIDLLLNLYQINRCLQNSDDERKVKYMTWTTISILLVVYVLLVFLKLSLDPLWNWSRAAFIAITLIFDLEMLYFVFITFFLTCKTERWRLELNAKLTNCKGNAINESEAVDLNEMFLIFKLIIDTLELTGKASKWMILFHFVISFTQALTYFEILILWKKNDTSIDSVAATSHLYGVVLWVLKSLITETILCITCEIFYRRISAAQLQVILYFGERPYCKVRKFKKNIFRLSTTRSEKICPFGIFYVDAALPLRMGGLLANYIIVLLQFAFL